MTRGHSYEDWLRANPQALVERRGGYANITPEEWGAHDRALVEWQERRRERAVGGPSKDLPHHATNPEALCICGLPGVVSRQRRGGGRPIWRCEQHRNLWPEYAVEFALISPDTKSGE